MWVFLRSAKKNLFAVKANSDARRRRTLYMCHVLGPTGMFFCKPFFFVILVVGLAEGGRAGERCMSVFCFFHLYLNLLLTVYM